MARQTRRQIMQAQGYNRALFVGRLWLAQAFEGGHGPDAPLCLHAAMQEDQKVSGLVFNPLENPILDALQYFEDCVHPQARKLCARDFPKGTELQTLARRFRPSTAHDVANIHEEAYKHIAGPRALEAFRRSVFWRGVAVNAAIYRARTGGEL